MPADFTHESALKVLSKIRSASVLYQSHFVGRLENNVDNLYDGIQSKQKGLDKQAKTLLKNCDFESILQYMKHAGEGSESHKSMRKCLKEKVQFLSE